MALSSISWEEVGNNDLLYDDYIIGSFRYVALRDADDGNVIVVCEEDIPASIERLEKTVKSIMQDAVNQNIEHTAKEVKSIMSETELIKAAGDLVELSDRVQSTKKELDMAQRSYEAAQTAYKKKADAMKDCVGRNIDRRLIVVNDTLVEIVWKENGTSVNTSPVLIA